jgi:predicted RNA binding protein YcfA (HicA-like mRNA interferase family)
MGRLANISGEEAASAFGKAGWQVMGQVGSHLIMTKSGMRAKLSIPQHKRAFNRNFASFDTSCGNDG